MLNQDNRHKHRSEVISRSLVSQDLQSAIEDTQVLIHTNVPSCLHLILFMWVCLSSYEELNNFGGHGSWKLLVMYHHVW